MMTMMEYLTSGRFPIDEKERAERRAVTLKHGRITMICEIADMLTDEQIEIAYRRMAELEERET